MLIVLVLGGRQAGATEYSSTNFKVIDPVISVGGGRSTSNTYQAEQSFGQPAAGISSSASFELKGGFLYFPAPSVSAPAPAATPTPTPSVVGTGGPLFPSAIVFPALRLVVPPPAEVLERCRRAGFEPSDLNCDGKVNLEDLSIFLYFSSVQEKLSPADLNRDAKVDTRDLSILFSRWNGKILTFTPESQIKALAEKLSVAAPEGGLAFVGGGKVQATSTPQLAEGGRAGWDALRALFSLIVGLLSKLAGLIKAIAGSVFQPVLDVGSLLEGLIRNAGR